MKKNKMIYLLILCFIIQSKTEYTFEIIEELIPKSFIFNTFEYSYFKILKYNLLCNENIKNNTLTDINFQIYATPYVYRYLYFYNDYSKISQDDNFNFLNYTSKKEIDLSSKSLNILFDNLTCNKDYYFIISYAYFPNFKKSLILNYFQISIINKETNIFSLSPLLSDFYSIIPRTKDKEENFSYYFNPFSYFIRKKKFSF